MTRGNQREVDRARAQARQAKYGKKDNTSHGDKLTQQTNQADIMREKQRIADLKKAGKWPEEDQQQNKKKDFDTSYLKQFEGMGLEDNEEEKQPDDGGEDLGQDEAQIGEVIQNNAKGKKAKGKKGQEAVGAGGAPAQAEEVIQPKSKKKGK